MTPEIGLQVLYKVANAPIHAFPFPHLYVQDVFPAAFYRELRANLPDDAAFTDLKKLERVGAGYSDARLVLPLTRDFVQRLPGTQRKFWDGFAKWLFGGFGEVILSKFGVHLAERFGDVRKRQFYDEAFIVRDGTTYSLGPHTDATAKVLSFLFYLPADDALADLGTSIYVPRQPGFSCKGGPHYRFEDFQRMATMPFVPNALFAFLKTYNSFHGVEPVPHGVAGRDLLLYDIKVVDPPEEAANEA